MSVFKRFFSFFLSHKVITFSVLFALIWGGFAIKSRLLKDTEEISYSTAVVETSTIISTVSGSGQIANVEQIDLKAKVSGDLWRVNVEKGQAVKAGQILFSLDSSDVTEQVSEAETALETAKLQMERLMEPPDEYSIFQSENSIIQAEESLADAEDSLSAAYYDGYTDISAAFLSLPNLISSLDSILNDSDINGYQADVDAYQDIAYKYDTSVRSMKESVDASYVQARTDHTDAFDYYKVSSRNSSRDEIEDLTDRTLKAAESLSDAVKSTKNLIDFVEDTLTIRSFNPPQQTSGDQSQLNSLTSSVNSIISSLSKIKDSLKSAKDAIIRAERSLEEKRMSYDNLIATPDDFDIRSQEITIRQKETALSDAKAKYADYVVTAPFDGIISDVNVRNGDTVSGSTILSTLVTSQKVAEISLNEVDVAKVSIGQKATIEFDALDDISVTGTVIDMDSVGTTSQGVVNYGIKLSLDSQDSRILSGMSIFVSIITNVVPGTLSVPNSAVKTTNGQPYVEILEVGENGVQMPVRVRVTIGVANDVSTEILEGLNEGDVVVTGTKTNGGSGSNSTQQVSGGGNIMQMMGGGQTNRAPR